MNTDDNHQPTTSHEHRGKTGIIIGAVIGLTLMAIWLVPNEEPKHPELPLPLANPVSGNPQTPAPPETVPSVLEQPAPVADAQPRAEAREGQTARELLAKSGHNAASVDKLFSQAEALRQSGKLADAHLLYFATARQGHAGAAMILAKQADPAFYATGNSVLDQPDVTQARKWYLVAVDAGDSSATRLLKDLRQYVQARADAGDPDSNRLLLQWK